MICLLGQTGGLHLAVACQNKKAFGLWLSKLVLLQKCFCLSNQNINLFFFKNVLPLHLFDHIVVESYGMSKCILPLSQKSKSGLEDNFPTFECQPLKRLSLDRASSADREAIHPMCWQTVSIFCPILQPKPTNIEKKDTSNTFILYQQCSGSFWSHKKFLNPWSDQHLISLYNVTPERNISSREERKWSLTK